MAIYRIHLTLADGKRADYTALFADTQEAIDQTMADFPEARAVSAMFICRRSV